MLHAPCSMRRYHLQYFATRKLLAQSRKPNILNKQSINKTRDENNNNKNNLNNFPAVVVVVVVFRWTPAAYKRSFRTLTHIQACRQIEIFSSLFTSMSFTSGAVFFSFRLKFSERRINRLFLNLKEQLSSAKKQRTKKIFLRWENINVSVWCKWK